MNHKLLYTTSLTVFFIFFSGCSSSQLYSTKDDIAHIEAKIDTLEHSLQKTHTQNAMKDQSSLERFAHEQQQVLVSLKRQLHQLQADHNATQLILRDYLAKSKPKQVIVYKDKKQVSRLKDKLVLGQAENVSIEPPGLLLRARIDTGADTSSIDARDIEEFERDGKKWVKFTLYERKDKKSHPIEVPISRHVKIIQSSLPDGFDRRIVVKLKLRIGDVSDLSEFTLTNREHMDFPILIGRNVLKDIAVVDVSSKDLAPLKQAIND